MVGSGFEFVSIGTNRKDLIHMIKLEKTEVYGWEAAIRGMRNPLNSWHLSDSKFDGEFDIGENDYDLMVRLILGGSSHAKFRRMINVTVDITAPLYWWKEFDTYKVGTVANSCSTMHKIHDKEFALKDFSHEKLNALNRDILKGTVGALNYERELFLKTKDKEHWNQMIQLLPSSYNQKRTVQLNYEVLAGIYPDRKHHKLDEWHKLCAWIESLPYSELITVR
jgi:hypothetical protein